MDQNITLTESRLEQFAAISDPNSITPQTLADLLTYLLERVEQAITDIYEDGSNINVYAYNGGPIDQLLNDLDSRINALKTIVVPTKDDERLKDLDSGVYSVAIGTTPYIFVVTKVSANAQMQYLIRISLSQFNIQYRKNTGVWSSWTTYKFSSQEHTYGVEHGITNDVEYFDLTDIPIPYEYGVFHIRVFSDENLMTEFTGTLLTWFRPDEALQFYHIFAPTGIYSATAAQNANPTNWSFKQYMFSEDISALQQQVQTNTTNIATLQQLIGYTIEQLQTL